jgi:hypothetical protein
LNSDTGTAIRAEIDMDVLLSESTMEEARHELAVPLVSALTGDAFLD